MKIAILNGSPRKGNTAAMADAFAKGAAEAGHELKILHVGQMNISGCLGCEYCHTKGNGTCIQKDDMDKVLPAYREADVIVFASPVYYFGASAQLTAAIQRVYCIGKPQKAKKAVLLLSSGSPDTGKSAEEMYRSMIRYMGIEDAGVCALSGADCQSKEKLAEIEAWAKTL